MSPRLIRSTQALYVGVAIMALPFILFGLGYHVSGFDCYDGSWADSVSMVERDAIYQAAGQRVRIGMIVAALIGLVPFGMAVMQLRRGESRVGMIFAALIVAVWILYALAYLLTAGLFSCQ